MKRLTVIASLLLVPTFIVGLYGQNFRNIPELHWGFGYAWSWGADHRDDDRPARVLPPQALDLSRHALCTLDRDAVLHLPALQDPPRRRRRPRGAHDAAARVPAAAASASCSSCSRTTTRRRRPASSSATRSAASSRPGEGVFELTGFSEGDLMGRDVAEALGLSDSARDRDRARMGRAASSSSSCRCARAPGMEKEVIGDFFPAYDDDGGLLVAPDAARSGATSTRLDGQRSARTQSLAAPAAARRRPAGRARSAGAGTAPSPRAARACIRSRSIFTGSSCRVKPSRCESRRTCVSTTIPCALPRSAETTFAVLRATPGSRSSVVELGRHLAVVAPRSGSASCRAATSPSAGRSRSRRCRARAPRPAPRGSPRAGGTSRTARSVTRLTFTSVVCAESITETSSSSGLAERERDRGVGVLDREPLDHRPDALPLRPDPPARLVDVAPRHPRDATARRSRPTGRALSRCASRAEPGEAPVPDQLVPRVDERAGRALVPAADRPLPAEDEPDVNRLVAASPGRRSPRRAVATAVAVPHRATSSPGTGRTTRRCHRRDRPRGAASRTRGRWRRPSATGRPTGRAASTGTGAASPTSPRPRRDTSASRAERGATTARLRVTRRSTGDGLVPAARRRRSRGPAQTTSSAGQPEARELARRRDELARVDPRDRRPTARPRAPARRRARTSSRRPRPAARGTRRRPRPPRRRRGSTRARRRAAAAGSPPRRSPPACARRARSSCSRRRARAARRGGARRGGRGAARRRARTRTAARAARPSSAATRARELRLAVRARRTRRSARAPRRSTAGYQRRARPRRRAGRGSAQVDQLEQAVHRVADLGRRQAARRPAPTPRRSRRPATRSA